MYVRCDVHCAPHVYVQQDTLMRFLSLLRGYLNRSHVCGIELLPPHDTCMITFHVSQVLADVGGRSCLLRIRKNQLV